MPINSNGIEDTCNAVSLPVIKNEQCAARKGSQHIKTL